MKNASVTDESKTTTLFGTNYKHRRIKKNGPDFLIK